MCRLLGYLGPAQSLKQLLWGGDHSLYQQSYRPREMLSGTVNVDGFGVGWYVPDDATPARYVSTTPLWADANIGSLATKLSTHCALLSVRGATDGMPFGPAQTAPFVQGRFLFQHNGAVSDFRRTIKRRLCNALGDEWYAGIEGSTDSEHLFALFLEHWDRGGRAMGAAALTRALAAAIRDVIDWSRAAGTRALLNVMLSDGVSLLGARASSEGPPPSLYTRCRDGAVWIASEPLDGDPRWQMLKPQHVFVAERDALREVAL